MVLEESVLISIVETLCFAVAIAWIVSGLLVYCDCERCTDRARARECNIALFAVSILLGPIGLLAASFPAGVRRLCVRRSAPKAEQVNAHEGGLLH